MREYKVRVLDSVFDDIGGIADFIISVSTPDHAVKYVRQLYDDPFPYATPAAGVSFKAGSSTFFDMKIGYEIAHTNDVYIQNGRRGERGSFTLKTINFSWGVTFKL